MNQPQHGPGNEVWSIKLWGQIGGGDGVEVQRVVGHKLMESDKCSNAFELPVVTQILT